MKLNKTFYLLALFFGVACSSTFDEAAKIISLTVVPEHIERYTVIVDDTVLVPSFSYDGELTLVTRVIGSHEEQRQRTIPETLFITYECQHGQHNVSCETEHYPILRGGLKKGQHYFIKYTKTFGVSHPNLINEFNKYKRVTIEDKK